MRFDGIWWIQRDFMVVKNGGIMDGIYSDGLGWNELDKGG
jgi:hypothetical protein